MKQREFDWSAESSATKHGYSVEQILGVFQGKRFLFKVKKKIYAILGPDDDGNLLEVIYKLTDEGKTKVFHCDRMRDSWRKRYERSKR